MGPNGILVDCRGYLLHFNAPPEDDEVLTADLTGHAILAAISQRVGQPMPEFEDLYEILQVHPSAHPEVIQASHRQLTQLYDPNLNPYPNASEMLDAVHQAYEALSDPARRATYDQYRRTRSQVPDVIQAKSFQVFDDEGNVRAELGYGHVSYGDSSDAEPVLELKDSDGRVRFSASLDYFDQPRPVMGDAEEGEYRFSVSVEDSGETRLVMRDQGANAQLEASGGSLVVRDAEGPIRLRAGLGGGDEGDNPRLIMRDRAGRIRLEIELTEVELDQVVAKVGDDYELSPLSFAFPPTLRMLDQKGNIRLEVGLIGTDSANSPVLRVLDDEENPRLEIGYSGDSPWIVMKDKDGVDRLEVELAEVEVYGGYDYIPQLRVRD